VTPRGGWNPRDCKSARRRGEGGEGGEGEGKVGGEKGKMEGRGRG
jgi:hypothetical protein